jgi:hypothetical protein
MYKENLLLFLWLKSYDTEWHVNRLLLTMVSDRSPAYKSEIYVLIYMGAYTRKILFSSDFP